MTAKPVINVDELSLHPTGNGAGFDARVASVGPNIGLKGLDCLLHVVEPGKKAFPRHVHHNEHELFLILEGEGTYRFGDASYAIKAGDVCAAPTGGIETAHQILNTGTVTLKYLGIANVVPTEVCEYPDSGKVAVWSGFDPVRGEPRVQHIFAQTDKALGYHDGEA